MNQNFQLDDVEVIAKENPDTFYIPSLKARQKLKKGDIVKLMFRMKQNGSDEPSLERMWVIIEEKVGEEYIGELNNVPVGDVNVKVGDKVRFEPRHIMEISQSAKLGQIKFLVIAILVIGFSLTTILTYLTILGSDKLMVQLIRFVFIIVFVLGTYRGSKIARTLLTLYLLLNVWTGILGYGSGSSHWVLNSITVFYLFSAIYLRFSKDITVFVNSRRSLGVLK